MNRPSFRPFLITSAVFVLVLSFSLTGADAVEIHVPQDYANIQTAVAVAAAGDTVIVDPGVYIESITMKNGVTIRGREAARTFLSGNGGGPVVIASGPVSAGIHNFTFVQATFGIQVVSNPSVLSITNNIFHVGTGGVGVSVQDAPLTQVTNNTFFQNGTAVATSGDIAILNNIFAKNITAISGASAFSANLSNNNFFDNTTAGPTGINAVTGDPLFASTGDSDFHLRQGSPCIDRGSTAIANDYDGTHSDIGAYGGPSADPTPFPVQQLTVDFTAEDYISFSWSPNNDYHVTNSTKPGKYKVYYGYAPGVYNGTDAEFGEAPSPINAGTDTFFELAGLSPASLDPLSAPALAPPSPRDGALVLSWPGVINATGYRVHYGILSKGENDIDVGDTTAYRLEGLTNGQLYHVAVSAYSTASTYYIVVTAVDNTGEAHESVLSNQLVVGIGGSQKSGLSVEYTDYPEPIIVFPDLPSAHQGCFIATAAYGYYSAPEVRALRVFRDRYLLTNSAGRTFVKWYYRRGPAAAAYLNAHPGLKALVRAALMPAVGTALFLTKTSALTKTVVMLIVGTLILVIARKRREKSIH